MNLLGLLGHTGRGLVVYSLQLSVNGVRWYLFFLSRALVLQRHIRLWLIVFNFALLTRITLLWKGTLYNSLNSLNVLTLFIFGGLDFVLLLLRPLRWISLMLSLTYLMSSSYDKLLMNLPLLRCQMIIQFKSILLDAELLVVVQEGLYGFVWMFLLLILPFTVSGSVPKNSLKYGWWRPCSTVKRFVESYTRQRLWLVYDHDYRMKSIASSHPPLK